MPPQSKAARRVLFSPVRPINLEGGPDRKVAFNWVTLYYTAALEKGEKKGGKSLPTNELSFGSIAEPFRQNHGRENGDSGALCSLFREPF